MKIALNDHEVVWVGFVKPLCVGKINPQPSRSSRREGP